VDIDVFVAVHRAEWERLDVLTRRARQPRRMSGAELDELVDLYQRTATHLSIVRSRFREPVLLDALSARVTRARSAVAGARDPGWRELLRFVTVTFPAAVWIRRWWILGAAAGSLLVMVGFGVWIAHDAGARGSLATPARVQALCTREFSDYYRSAPAGSFAAKVWTNNAWVAAGAIAFGGLLGVPTLFLLFTNALNVGIDGGLMSSCGRTPEFFTLILPHGMLELTAVFVAAGAGLRLGWRVIDPGPRRRSEALAAEGRGAIGIAIGLVGVLAISGAIEAFVTPSSLPPFLRLAIGVLAELLFIGYVVRFGARAVAAAGDGPTPDDLELGLDADLLPVG
jgi:uncharacterized membrane protein SpoIIM required for sporulation